jgi:hypothetical protein
MSKGLEKELIKFETCCLKPAFKLISRSSVHSKGSSKVRRRDNFEKIKKLMTIVGFLGHWKQRKFLI